MIGNQQKGTSATPVSRTFVCLFVVFICALEGRFPRERWSIPRTGIKTATPVSFRSFVRWNRFSAPIDRSGDGAKVDSDKGNLMTAMMKSRSGGHSSYLFACPRSTQQPDDVDGEPHTNRRSQAVFPTISKVLIAKYPPSLASPMTSVTVDGRVGRAPRSRNRLR